jgi:hypothetical protein
VNGLSTPERCHVSGSGDGSFVGGGTLFLTRLTAGRSSASASMALLCFAGTARDGVFARGGGTSASSVDARVVRREVRLVVVGGGATRVSSSASSVVTVLAELDGTSWMPRVDRFVRACARCTCAAWGATASLNRPTSTGFFADEGYETPCLSRMLRSSGTVILLASTPGSKYQYSPRASAIVASEV